mmetsp:Transcript_95610/g.276190  ORF Transcript_95610/g.276190 Transcript_95610/m.276190 type:complete len:211 (-) Transcript_95610:505-1137(-)
MRGHMVLDLRQALQDVGRSVLVAQVPRRHPRCAGLCEGPVGWLLGLTGRLVQTSGRHGRRHVVRRVLRRLALVVVVVRGHLHVRRVHGGLMLRLAPKHLQVPVVHANRRLDIFELVPQRPLALEKLLDLPLEILVGLRGLLEQLGLAFVLGGQCVVLVSLLHLRGRDWWRRGRLHGAGAVPAVVVAAEIEVEISAAAIAHPSCFAIATIV